MTVTVSAGALAKLFLGLVAAGLFIAGAFMLILIDEESSARALTQALGVLAFELGALALAVSMPVQHKEPSFSETDEPD